jgi:TolA-binding protein
MRRDVTSARIGAGTARRALLMVSLGAGLILPGCATKKDIRLLQTAMADMQAHQDSAMREMQRQQASALRAMMDTVRHATAITLDTRGQTSQRLGDASSILQSVQAMTSQLLEGQQRQNARIDGLATDVQALKQAQMQAPPVSSTSSSSSSPSGQSAQQLYDAGTRAMSSASFGTARASFRALVKQFHDDSLAPRAQFQIGESYAMENSYDEAYSAFALVASEWPAATTQASEALYRAGKLAEDHKDYTTARLYYRKVVNLYKNSDAAAQANAALRKLPSK